MCLRSFDGIANRIQIMAVYCYCMPTKPTEDLCKVAHTADIIR